ncbi:MAG: hypothetical protein IIY60_00410 [Clostridia bacterium]|nr:hypothetical protein [Clostridia bacterium]
MGLLEQIDMELQKDLINFVKSQEKKPWPHTLGESLLTEILKDIIKGDARISGCVTDHGKKRMYLEVSFFEKDEDEKHQEQ